MDGGFFLCPDAWEFLLPAEIRHLRDAGSVCRKRWDLLTLTPMGCALLPEPAVRLSPSSLMLHPFRILWVI